MKHLFTMMLALIAATASAQDFEVNGICYNILSEDDRTVEVTSNYGSYAGDIVIPAEVTYDGSTYSVTAIGDDAFNWCESLTSVSMSSATMIGDWAFYYCNALTSVSMPSVVTIGENAFYTCSALTSVSMPSATTIGDYAFEYCYALTSVEMPEATTIGEYAFADCSALTSIYLPASCTSIDGNPFIECYALKEIVVNKDNPNFSSHDGVLYDKDMNTLIACPGSKSSIDTRHHDRRIRILRLLCFDISLYATGHDDRRLCILRMFCFDIGLYAVGHDDRLCCVLRLFFFDISRNAVSHDDRW